MSNNTEKIEAKNHSILIESYENFVSAMVILPSDLYFDVVLKAGSGNFDYERFVINDFKNKIFNESYKGQQNFSFPSEFYDFMRMKGQKVDREKNDWFKKVCFNLNSPNNLKEIKNFIKKKSIEFESVQYRLP